MLACTAQPVKFYDIVVQVAIIRPGPIVGNMVNPFLQRRQAGKRFPILTPLLKRCWDAPRRALISEQLLRMAMITANFTGGEAEELRRPWAQTFRNTNESIEENCAPA